MSGITLPHYRILPQVSYDGLAPVIRRKLQLGTRGAHRVGSRVAVNHGTPALHENNTDAKPRTNTPMHQVASSRLGRRLSANPQKPGSQTSHLHKGMWPSPQVKRPLGNQSDLPVSLRVSPSTLFFLLGHSWRGGGLHTASHGCFRGYWKSSHHASSEGLHL